MTTTRTAAPRSAPAAATSTGALSRVPAPGAQSAAASTEAGPDLRRSVTGTARELLPRGGYGPPASEVPPLVFQVLSSSGQPLDARTRAFFEPRFGRDFSDVRVHADTAAAESAGSLDALAYTVGRDVAFGPGRYRPETDSGQRLLAHELTHVVQQRHASVDASALRLGAADDVAETEADRVASEVMRGGEVSAPQAVGAVLSRAMIQRQTTGAAPAPQRADETRMATLPAEADGEAARRVHVIRSFEPCSCRNVPEARSGIFYNSDLNNLAIAYRYCRGATTTDIYGQLESNAAAFLQGGAPPTGTARVGIDVNVRGRSVGGRLILEAIGTNQEQGREGVGGRAQVVFDGGRWRVFLEPQFIRRLQDLPGGQTQNDLQLSLGGQIGSVTARIDMKDLLDPARRSGSGTICIPAGGSVDICPTLEVGGGRGVTGGINLRVPLDIPPVRNETCYQCVCPPPTKKYECIADTPPSEREVTESVEREQRDDFRFYFRLDRTDPSEDAALRAQTNSSLSALASAVRQGGRVDYIFGYASPETSERHNETLSLQRAVRTRDAILQAVGAGTPLPAPVGAGEVLGRTPTASPSSQLGDIITQNGFRAAEDLTVVLTGPEIPNDQLAGQLRSLFAALPEPADRLAVFGLTAADPLAAQTLAAVARFMQGGGGSRPWEQIFRPLRMSIARVTRTVQVDETTTVRSPGSVESMSDAACQPYARRAESSGELGPIAEGARRPSTRAEENNADCTRPPDRADVQRGCDYSLVPGARRRATPPAVAPQELR